MTSSRDLRLVGFFPYPTNPKKSKVPKWLQVLLLTFIFSSTCIVMAYQVDKNSIPISGFSEFDDLYQTYMVERNNPLIDDVMDPINSVVFDCIKLMGSISGALLLLLLFINVAFTVWYGAQPEFVERVSEVKQRVASGEKIPIDEVSEFFMQFLPDIKANSGIADSYIYEKPTISLVIRDHLPKFIMLFTIIICLRTGVIFTFVIKSADALSYGFKYYTESIDFVGKVDTFTKAGKDYNPYYDTVTTEGRNKKKTYNAIYTALKDQKPRDRTGTFLQRIGTAVEDQVKRLEEEGNVKFGYQNFSVHATVTDYEVNPDTSEVKWVEKFSLSEHFNMIIGEDIDNEKYLYLKVFQHNKLPGETHTSNPLGRTSNYESGWIYDANLGYPTRIEMEKEFTRLLNEEGYVFKKTTGSKLVATALLKSGKTIKLDNVPFTVTDKQFHIDLTGITPQLNSIGVTDALDQIVVTGLSNVTLVKQGEGTTRTKSLGADTAYWYPPKN